jgi:hypothetical protein
VTRSLLHTLAVDPELWVGSALASNRLVQNELAIRGRQKREMRWACKAHRISHFRQGLSVGAGISVAAVVGGTRTAWATVAAGAPTAGLTVATVAAVAAGTGATDTHTWAASAAVASPLPEDAEPAEAALAAVGLAEEAGA